MKRFFVFFTMAVMTSVSALSQSALIATLTHEGNISTFYGASALQQAHAAAADGDIITLSSGSFQSVDITKGITIRGAGMQFMDNGAEPTIITGDFNIGSVNAGPVQNLTFEGLYSNSTVRYFSAVINATFLKCRFQTFDRNGANARLQDAQFIHCRVGKELILNGSSSATCIGCVIWKPSTSYEGYNSFQMQNCVLYNGNSWDGFQNSSLRNCILIADKEYAIPSSTNVYNCVDVYENEGTSLFNNVPNSTNKRVQGLSNILKSGTMTYGDSFTYELTDEALATYLGSDGTQVGIYGGNLPFDATPTNPQIKKCNVASRSTADGKLSVEIEVSSAQ